MKSTKLFEILEKEYLNRTEIIELLDLEEKSQIDELYMAADKRRSMFCGDEVHVRAVVDISNYCTQHCMYCEMREDNFSLKRYRMRPDEIIDIAKKISKLGIGTIVIQSGEDVKFDTDIVAYLIYSIKQSADIAVTLSLGERGLDEYQRWKIAGADRYILKFETSNERKYSVYRNKKLLNDRVQHLKYLKRIGFQIGSGNIVGLPSQTIDDIADDIILLKGLDVDTAIFDLLIPVPFTPYQNLKPGSLELTLKTISVARLVLKNVHIVSNAFDICFDKYGEILNCGVNAIMPSFTPQKYSEISNSVLSVKEEINPFENQKKIKKKIEILGRQISFSRGDSLKKSSPNYL